MRAPRHRFRRLPRAAVAVLGALVLASLAACGGSAKGLIPAGQAGPLLGDFEAVQRAAEKGDGECAATDSALAKTEEDFAALSSTVDAGLRDNLRQGIENLSTRAHELCTQPLAQTTTTTTTKTPTTTTKTTPPPTTTSTTQTTPPPTTQTTTTPPVEEPEHEKPAGPGGAPVEEPHKENPGGAEPDENPTASNPGGAGAGAPGGLG